MKFCSYISFAGQRLADGRKQCPARSIASDYLRWYPWTILWSPWALQGEFQIFYWKLGFFFLFSFDHQVGEEVPATSYIFMVNQNPFWNSDFFLFLSTSIYLSHSSSSDLADPWYRCGPGRFCGPWIQQRRDVHYSDAPEGQVYLIPWNWRQLILEANLLPIFFPVCNTYVRIRCAIVRMLRLIRRWPPHPQVSLTSALTDILPTWRCSGVTTRAARSPRC